MFDHERLFTAALQLADPIYVQRVEFDESLNGLHLYLDFCKGGRFACPECGRGNLSVHDTIEKVWRHLNFFQYKAFIHFRTPRVVCPEHGGRCSHSSRCWSRKRSIHSRLPTSAPTCRFPFARGYRKLSRPRI